MYHIPAKNICLVAMAILLFSILGCSNREKEAYQGEQSNSKTDVTAEDATKSETVRATFIELGSTKCIPCKAMQPIVKEIEEEYKGQVKVVFYDVWTSEGEPYAQKYDIRVIPTQVFLDKDGNEYFRHEGFFPKDELVKVLKEQGVK